MYLKDFKTCGFTTELVLLNSGMVNRGVLTVASARDWNNEFYTRYTVGE